MPVVDAPYDAIVTFPNRGWQVVTYFCFLICIVVNTGIIARRASQYKRTLTTFKPLSSFWLCDLLALLVFLVSFVFVAISGVLTFGIGTAHSETCDASIIMCVSVFVLTKVLLYLYYLERLYLVSYLKNPVNTGEPVFLNRLRCLPYMIGGAIFALGVPCAILLGLSKDWALIYMSSDPAMTHAVGCHVFLRWGLAAPVIIWAFLINVYLIISYTWLLVKRQLQQSSESRTLVRSTIFSLVISGVSTVINLTVLLLLKGEHAAECLLCCGIDVVVNSLALAVITDGRGEKASFSLLHSGPSDKPARSNTVALPQERVPMALLSSAHSAHTAHTVEEKLHMDA